MSDRRPLSGSTIPLLLASLAPVVPAMVVEAQSKTSPSTDKPAFRQTAEPKQTGTTPTEAGARPSPFPEQKRPTQARPRFIIPAGTAISVRLGETLDTKRAHPGDPFSATLDEAILVRGRVIIPKGTIFSGYVIESQPSGRLRGRGVLGLTLDSFRLRGVTYRVLTAADFHRSGDHKKRDVVLVAGGTGIGAALGKISGAGAAIGAGAGAAAGTTAALVTGKRNVKVTVETPLVFSLRNAVDVRG